MRIERTRQKPGLWEQLNFVLDVLGRLMLVIIFTNLLISHGTIYLEKQKLSSLLYVGLELLLIGLVVCRKQALRFSSSPFDWLIGLLGTLLPLLIVPTSNPDYMPALLVQNLGFIITLSGLIMLNRSFAVVAADRGIKTGGIYKIIRHPLYAGYTLTYFAMLANHYTHFNLMIVVVWMIFQVLRIFREERFLSHNPLYAEYLQKTRWRLCPYVW